MSTIVNSDVAGAYPANFSRRFAATKAVRQARCLAEQKSNAASSSAPLGSLQCASRRNITESVKPSIVIDKALSPRNVVANQSSKAPLSGSLAVVEKVGATPAVAVHLTSGIAPRRASPVTPNVLLGTIGSSHSLVGDLASKKKRVNTSFSRGNSQPPRRPKRTLEETNENVEDENDQENYDPVSYLHARQVKRLRLESAARENVENIQELLSRDQSLAYAHVQNNDSVRNVETPQASSSDSLGSRVPVGRTHGLRDLSDTPRPLDIHGSRTQVARVTRVRQPPSDVLPTPSRTPLVTSGAQSAQSLPAVNAEPPRRPKRRLVEANENSAEENDQENYDPESYLHARQVKRLRLESAARSNEINIQELSSRDQSLAYAHTVNPELVRNIVAPRRSPRLPTVDPTLRVSPFSPSSPLGTSRNQNRRSVLGSSSSVQSNTTANMAVREETPSQTINALTRSTTEIAQSIEIVAPAVTAAGAQSRSKTATRRGKIIRNKKKTGLRRL